MVYSLEIKRIMKNVDDICVLRVDHFLERNFDLEVRGSMMKRRTWLLSIALVLVACDTEGNPPKDLPPIDPETLTEPVIVAEFSEPAQFAQASLTLSDGAKSDQYQGILYKNYAYFVLKNLPNPKAAYHVSVDTFDQKGGVELFGKTFKHDFGKQRVVYVKDFKRLKSDVEVSVSSVAAKTNQLVAKLGQQSNSMKIENGTAKAVFKDVETSKRLTVSVEGKDADGTVTQTGDASFKHGKIGSKINVALNTVVNCPKVEDLTTIPAVQGTGATSPVVGQSVTVNGVVTSNLQSGIGGFFIQDAKGDGKVETSDAVFVYTGRKPQDIAIGDVIQLTGTVKEYKSSRDKKADTATQIDTLTKVVKCGVAAKVKPVDVRAPFNFERYEGMLVRFPEKLTVTNNYFYGRYGELGLSAGGRLFQPTNGNTNTTKPENEARLVGLNDGSNKQNPQAVPFLDNKNTRRTGDTISNLTGVLRYSNDAYKVEATVPPVFKSKNLRNDAPAKINGDLKVASVNVLNYFTTFGSRGADSQYEFDRQKTKIVASLKKLDADILALVEIENNQTTAIYDLVTALNKSYGSEVYKALYTGELGDDAIKLAMLYKPKRVGLFGLYAADKNPVYSRPPLAQGFRDLNTGGIFTVIASHFKSKGSCPKTGDIDQGQGCWNLLRTKQAKQLVAFAERMKIQNEDQDVLLVGDFNSYGAEDPIKVLEAAGYTDEMKRVAASERYTYQFAGRFGYLDSALASKSLSKQVAGMTAWHINSDEPKFIDYNVEYKKNPNCPNKDKCTSPDLYKPDPFRASDHDPILVGLNLNKDQGDRVLVSQLYHGSGYSGAAYTHDFVELFNAGTSTVNLSKYSVVFSHFKRGWWEIALSDINLAPGQYYLVQTKKVFGDDVGKPLPTPDLVANRGMYKRGTVATLYKKVAPNIKPMRDRMSIPPEVQLTPTQSFKRVGEGCTDTDDNDADFITVEAAPRNTKTAKKPCF